MKIPEVGSQLTIADESLYVDQVDDSGDRSYGVTSGMDALDPRVILTCYDNYGNEVEIRFYPDDEDEDF